MMIALYKRIPAKQIRQEAANAKRDIPKWFEANPKRRVCRVALWYNKQIVVRRKTVVEQIDKAMQDALQR